MTDNKLIHSIEKTVMGWIHPLIAGAIEGGNPEGAFHTIEEMRAWLKPLGYSDTINDAAIKFTLRDFVMREISTNGMMNMDMVVERLSPQLEVAKKGIEHFR